MHCHNPMRYYPSSGPPGPQGPPGPTGDSGGNYSFFIETATGPTGAPLSGPFEVTNGTTVRLFSNSGLITATTGSVLIDFDFAGGSSFNYIEVPGPYNITNNDFTIVVSGDNTTITLPPASDNFARLINIRPAEGSRYLTILPSIGDTVNSLSSITIYDQRDACQLQSDGVNNWTRIQTSEPLINPPSNIDLDLYISITGNDTNNGLTISTPVLTLKRVMEVAFERGWNNRVNINFDKGTYILPPGSIYTFRDAGRGASNQPFIFRGTRSIMVSDTIIDVSQKSLQPSNIYTITSSTAPLDGTYRGHVITFTSGALVGRSYQIADNIGNQIIVLNTNLAALAPGDSFIIEINDVTIVVDSIQFRDGMIGMRNITMQLNSRPKVTQFSFLMVKSTFVPDNLRVIADPNGAPGANMPFFLFETDLINSQNGAFLNIDSQSLGLIVDGSPSIQNNHIQFNLQLGSAFIGNSLIYQTQITFNSNFSSINTVYLAKSNSWQFTQGSARLNNLVIVNCGNGGEFLSFDASDLVFSSVLIMNIEALAFACNNNSMIDIRFSRIENSMGLYNINQSRLILYSVIIVESMAVGSAIATNSSIEFSSLSYNGPNGFLFNLCTFFSNDLSLGGITSGHYLQFNDSLIRAEQNLTLSGSGIFVFNSIHATNSYLNISSLTFTDGVLLPYLRNCIFYCNNIDFININTMNVFNIDTSPTVVINNWKATNQPLSLRTSNSNISISNLSVGGVSLGGPFIEANQNSNIALINGSVSALDATFLVLNDGSSANIQQCQFNNCTNYILNASNFTKLTLADITTTNHGSNFATLTNGLIYGSNINLGMVGGGSGLIINNSKANLFNVTITSPENYGIDVQQCSEIRAQNTNISNSGLDGIRIQNSTYYINNADLSGNGGNGITIQNGSKGSLISIISTIANNSYGVNLRTTSNFSNQTNIVSGLLGDVNVGALGPRTWTLINSGLVSDTTDFALAAPEYVYIGPMI